MNAFFFASDHARFTQNSKVMRQRGFRKFETAADIFTRTRLSDFERYERQILNDFKSNWVTQGIKYMKELDFGLSRVMQFPHPSILMHIGLIFKFEWTNCFCKFRLNDMSETKPDQTNSAPQPFTPIDQHLFESRIVFVSGEVHSELALKVNRQLLALEKANPTAPIVLWIDCPGGEVYSGFSIYDTVQFIQPRVITVVAGLAASMGSVIALAAEKQDRVCFPNSKLLIHQPLFGGVLRGQASDLEIHAKDIIQLKKKMHRLYAERTGTAESRFIELMERDRWVGPEEAIELGLVSKILSTRKDLDALLKR